METGTLTSVLTKTTDIEYTVIKLNWKVSMKNKITFHPNFSNIENSVSLVNLTQLKQFYSINRVIKFLSEFLKWKELFYIKKKQLFGNG